MMKYEVMVKVDKATGKELVFEHPELKPLFQEMLAEVGGTGNPAGYFHKAVALIYHVDARSLAQARAFARSVFNLLSGHPSSNIPCRGSFCVKKLDGQTARPIAHQ